MVVAVAYEIETEIESNGVTVEFSAFADVVGVADVTNWSGETSSEIVRAMRRQYGESVEVSIMTVDFLEVG